MPPFDPGKLLDLGRWFDPQPGPGSTWHVILGALFLIGIVAGFYLYLFVPRHQLRHDRYHAMLARNIAQGLLWISFIGLISVFFRLLDVGFFGMRLWLYLDLLVGLGLLVWLAVYLRRTYPKRIAAIERQRRLREWMHKPAAARRRH